MTGRRRGREERGAAKTLPKHAPRRNPDLGTDTAGHWWRRCGLPNYHPVHDLPDTPDDIVAAEARRYGEGSR